MTTSPQVTATGAADAGAATATDEATAAAAAQSVATSGRDLMDDNPLETAERPPRVRGRPARPVQRPVEMPDKSVLG
ncbi:hypothetical protein CCE01nite_10600 [Cellulomonas cellasea]|uniref:Uncharacterized protein n=1 Tax=Cellulomonas cellasea TaxID=43670 RepID=A0A4Y3KRQ8_9CELL|nr:hypothetical protein CCE01nite_10600 [Cellulomonas cellasea]